MVSRGRLNGERVDCDKQQVYRSHTPPTSYPGTSDSSVVPSLPLATNTMLLRYGSPCSATRDASHSSGGPAFNIMDDVPRRHAS